jgi:Uncharacterised nucleotidyltransferase
MTTSSSTAGALTGGYARDFRRNGSDLHGGIRVNAVEAGLTMVLASTPGVRETTRPRLGELLRQVDCRAYAAVLAERGLLSPLGSRAIEIAPEAADHILRSHVEAALREARLRALRLDTALRRVVRALEDLGIPTLPQKGTALAERLHSDTGLRPTTGLARTDRCRRRGVSHSRISAASGSDLAEGLPEMHYTFIGGDASAPRIELHWRVHWSERSVRRAVRRYPS